MKKMLVACSVIWIMVALAFQPVVAAPSTIAEPILQSAQNAPDCYSLDMVFLIDQSLSMSRQDEPNDPLNQRINAPRYALDWLANNRLSRLAICPDAIHRIGVISFGSEAQVDLDLTEIRPMNQQEWDPVLERLADKVQEHDMGGTNPIKAFTLAKEMLGQSAPLGDLPRKRALVLLTDGQPCLTEGCTESDEELHTYMGNLNNQIRQDFSFSEAVRRRDDAVRETIGLYGGPDQIPETVRNEILVNYPVSNDELFQSVYIWVVAMNDVRPYLDSVGAQFDSLASENNGDLIDLSQDPLAVPTVFNEIMSDLVELEPTLLGCGNLPVNPYLSGVVLDIYKVANGLEVEVKYEGKLLKNGNGDGDFFGLEQYSQYGAVEHYRFRNPPAGLWEIVCSDPNGADISYLPFNAQLQMVQPTGTLPHYDVGGALYDPVPAHQFFLKYKVIDQSSSQPLNLDPNYPLNMKAVVTAPDGSQTTQQFGFEGDGVWVSQTPLPVNLLDTYQVTVSAEADCVSDPQRPEVCESPTIEVISPIQDSYQVGNVSLFQIQVVAPEANGIVPLHRGLIPDWLAPQPVTVEVRLVDLDGQPLPVDQILASDATQVLDAELDTGNERMIIDLVPDPTLLGRFTGRFELTDDRGPHTLTISMPTEAYRFEDYRPLENPVTVQFTRQDPLLNNPLFYRILLALLVLVITGFIVYLIWLRTFPILGGLVFVKRDENGERNVPVNLARRKRQIALTGRSIPADLRSDFRKIKARNQPGQGKAPNRRTKVLVTLDKSTFNMVDGQSLTKGDWLITYAWGHPSTQRDRFALWAVVAILISIAVIVGILVA